jgi:hypothetical protein
MLPGFALSRFSCAFPSSALWLFTFLSLLPTAFGVCTNCFGNAAGCGGATASCPWIEGVAANVAIMAAATGGTLKVASLLPPKFLRLFPKAALEALSSLVAKVSTSGSPFDPDGKTVKEITKAVKEGKFSRGEAILHFNNLIQDSGDELEIKKLESATRALDHMDTTSLSDNGAMEGGFLYVLFKESSVFSTHVSGSTSFDFCGDCTVEATKSSSKTFTASLVRPKNAHAMYSLLNGFALTCHAVGLANILAMGPFLEDVVYEPVRSGTIEWMVAFERLIENGTGRYNVTNVIHAAGGIDSLRSQALISAKEHFSSAFFRTLGGNPNSGLNVLSPSVKDGEIYTGTVKGSRPSATKGCASWNMGKPHFAKNVDHKGMCAFLHKCDQYVSDKGPGGQCLGDHKRADCDYDATKKVRQPVKN